MKYLSLLILSSYVFLSGCASTPIDHAAGNAHSGNHQRAIDIFEKETGGNVDNWKTIGEDGGIPGPSYFVFHMDNICASYFSLRRFDKATECNESYKSKAFAIYDADPMEDTLYARTERRFQATYYYLKSAISLELGDFKSSYEQGEKAVLMNRSDLDEPESQLIGMKESAILNANTAISANQLGKRSRALELIADIQDFEVPFGSVELPKDSLMKNSQQARAFLAIGEYDKANESLNKSLAATGVAGRAMLAFLTFGTSEMTGMGKATTDPFSINTFFMRTKICFELGDYDCAQKGYDSMISGEYGEHLEHLPDQLKKETVEASLLIKRPAVHYIALYDRGVIAHKQGDAELALKYYVQAIDIIEVQRSTINTEASKIGFVGNKENLYLDTVALLIEMKRYDEAFVYAERAKARALVDTLASKQNLGTNKRIKNTSQILSSIQDAEIQLANTDFANEGKQRAASRAFLRKKQQSLINTQPELASLVTVTAPDLGELQALLPADETLLEYYGDNENLYVFILNRRGVGAVKLDAKNLAADISDFRATLSNPQDGAYRRNANSLYRRLISPVEARIKTNNVTIVPHGTLHYLPFNALMANNEFLIDRYNLRVLPSASVMKFLNKNSAVPNDLLALGNPDVGDPKLDLPGAQLEAVAVARTFKRTELLLRKKATETAVKTRGGEFKRIHFASHGLFDSEKPLSSGLLLAADIDNDGLLTVGELYDLDLNADLITLSACETALGTVANGDDVVGFTRGFLYAGANSIVSSLWKVDDAATNQLMQSFYTNMKRQDKRSSLRMAQLNIKKSRQHPYYWAAFQLTGSAK